MFVRVSVCVRVCVCTSQVCISYTVGALAGYVYLRLLGRSVDGYAPQSAVAGVGAAVGNQRLLLPLILALGYNR